MSRKLTSWNPNFPYNRLTNFLKQTREEYRKLPNLALKSLVNIELQRLTPEELEKVKQPTCRHEWLSFMEAMSEKVFKAKWLEEYGWPIEDCLDEVRWRIRRQEQSEKQGFAMLWADLERISKGERGEPGSEAAKVIEERIGVTQEALGRSRFEMKDGKIVWREGVTLETFAKPAPVPGPKGPPPDFPPFDTQQISDELGRIYTKAEFDALPAEGQTAIRTFMGQRISALAKSGYAGVLPGKAGSIVDRRLHPDATPVQQSSVLGTPKPKEVPMDTPAPAEVGD